MRCLGNAIDKLFTETNADGRAARIWAKAPEKRVVETLSAPKSRAASVEGATGHDDRVDFARVQRAHQTRARTQEASVRRRDAVAIERPQRRIERIFRGDLEQLQRSMVAHPWKCHAYAAGRERADDAVDFDFIRHRAIGEHDPCADERGRTQHR